MEMIGLSGAEPELRAYLQSRYRCDRKEQTVSKDSTIRLVPLNSTSLWATHPGLYYTK